MQFRSPLKRLIESSSLFSSFWAKGRLVATIIMALALFLQISDPLVLKKFRHQVFDIYQQWLPRDATTPRQVTVIDIDDASLLEMGQWPWPRHRLAELLTKLNEMGALVVGFDMLFAEQDRLSPENMAKNLGVVPKEVLNILKAKKPFDEIFANAIENQKTVLGMSISSDPDGANNYGYSTASNFAFLGASPLPFIQEYPALIGNLPILDNAAAGRGMVSLDQGFDGFVRRIPLLNRVGKKLLPTLTLDMLKIAFDQNVVVKTGPSGIEGLSVGRKWIPTDSHGRVWVKYSPFDPKRYISAYDILSSAVDPALIKNQFLLVGTSATGLKDLRSSPLASALPGVEMHAQLLENMLEQSVLFRADYLKILEWAGTLLTGTILILLVPLAGARLALGMLLLVSAVAISSTAYLFIVNSVLIDVTYTLFVSIGIYILLAYASFLSTEQERTRIHSAFSHYLSPELVKRLSISPDQLVLGGEQKEMTFLFCDIRDFTSISETYQNDPQALTMLLNSFLTPMTDQILKHNGTIDKYMGDAIMAFWNAPLNNDRHAQDAADAATAMISTLKELNQENSQGTQIQIGIGINTGNCVVGNLGSEQRFDYSVIGDAVNLASRLEGQSKTYGFDIIIGEKTATSISDCALIELDSIAVKGRTEATKVYALLGGPALIQQPDFQNLKIETDQLLQSFRSKEWEKAAEIAQRLKREKPSVSIFADLYLSRTKSFMETPPPDNWDGVYRAKSK
ncbi:MAG: adenylate/guanylate cyclase domain-containing protein [Sneathiella sp.]